MNLYLDASVVVALLTTDIFTARADAYIRAHAPLLVVSDFAGLEFASVIARRVRIRDITARTARSIFVQFDAWIKCNTQHTETANADVMVAVRAVRRAPTGPEIANCRYPEHSDSPAVRCDVDDFRRQNGHIGQDPWG